MAFQDLGDVEEAMAAVWEAYERAQDRALDTMFDFVEDMSDGS